MTVPNDSPDPKIIPGSPSNAVTGTGAAAALPRWEYATPGPLRERLSGLTLAGVKTATFGIDEISLAYGEALEQLGDRFVMIGTNGAALAVIEVTGLERCRLGDVTKEMVDAEGESFTSVEHWRNAHLTFWAPFEDDVRAYLRDPAWTVGDDTVVCCLRVRVVERLSGHDGARYPVVECVVATDDIELAVDALDQLNTIGVEEIDGGDGVVTANGRAVPPGAALLRAGFASDELAVAAEAALDRRFSPRYEVLLGDDWLDAWREHFTATRAGHVVIVPDWEGAPTARPDARPDDVVLRLDPARSFGTGGHPTTRLVIDQLQQVTVRGARVADVGCGSGVLTVAASLLGARSVDAVDVETAALATTLDNVRRNRIDPSIVRVATSLDPQCTYDLVLANILAPVLMELADVIKGAVAPGGTLVLAGLIESQRERILDAYAPLVAVGGDAAGEWVSLVLRRA